MAVVSSPRSSWVRFAFIVGGLWILLGAARHRMADSSYNATDDIAVGIGLIAAGQAPKGEKLKVLRWIDEADNWLRDRTDLFDYEIKLIKVNRNGQEESKEPNTKNPDTEDT